MTGTKAEQTLCAHAEGGVLAGSFRAGIVPAETPETRKLIENVVKRVKAGDTAAFRLLYIRYADSVYGYVKSILRDEHEAEDVTQQVFTKLYTIIHKYEPRDVSFSAWILRVAHNAAIDDMRRRRAIPVEEVCAL
jgi:RNA polymerase sigma-70 factor (ECF subfamily)